MPIDARHIPVKRPHFQVRDQGLFFLISRRPMAVLDPAAVEIWEAIDGTANVGQLQGRFSGAAEQVARFRDLGALEIVEADFGSSRIPVLVVEPHMDDAILSVGGQMWSRRHECEFTVLTVVGVSNFTTYERIGREYFDVATVSELRKAESRVVMRMLGGHHLAFDVPDAPLRYRPGTWTVDWYLRNRRPLAAFKNASPDPGETSALEERLLETFRTTPARQIWIPMGIGTAADHEMTRDACLGAILRAKDLLRDVDIFMYQDVPYVNQFPDHARQLVEAMATLGGELEPSYDDIGESLAAKLRMLAVFGSQFKPSYMDPKVEESARGAARPNAGIGERKYRFRSLPDRVDRELLYSGRDAIHELRSRLDRWCPKHRDAKRIRIVLPMGAGRWEESMRALRAEFPEAVFEVHINEQAMDETGRYISPGIDLRPVPGKPIAWVGRLLQLTISRPIPTIFVTSAKLRKSWGLLRLSFFPSEPLPVTTLDHLTLALKARRESPSARPHAS
jgi:LmbE family N-acetylglucosaminyl deacetylase